MKKCLVFVIAIWFANAAFSQNLSNKIKGSWAFIGVDGKKKGFIECPDFIEFNNDGNYTVYNDCYGKNPANPFIEKGIWTIESNTMKVLLSKRKFYTNYYFHKASPSVTFQIKEITNKTMKIHFLDKTDFIVEKYEKR